MVSTDMSSAQSITYYRSYITHQVPASPVACLQRSIRFILRLSEIGKNGSFWSARPVSVASEERIKEEGLPVWVQTLVHISTRGKDAEKQD